jgi:hypothetical protein
MTSVNTCGYLLPFLFFIYFLGAFEEIQGTPPGIVLDLRIFSVMILFFLSLFRHHVSQFIINLNHHHNTMASNNRFQGSQQQLQEIWAQDDGLKDEKFDPLLFFRLHG